MIRDANILRETFDLLKHELRPWGLLAYDAIHVLRDIYTDWDALLSDENTTERDMLRFLCDHAGLFLADPPEIPLVVSELRLGADYRADFLQVREGYSSGTSYTLIEVESPNAKLFRKDGRTSATLATAIDQISEWRRWVNAHRQEAGELLPSYGWQSRGYPNIQYSIIIGRREETQKEAARLSSLWKEQSITVHSFDRLTELFQRRSYGTFYMLLSANCDEVKDDFVACNKGCSPFLTAMSDRNWRDTIRSSDFSHHLTREFLKTAIQNIEYNNARLAKFDDRRAKADAAEVDYLLTEDFKNHVNRY